MNIFKPLRRDYSQQLYGHKQSISEESLNFDSKIDAYLEYFQKDIDTLSYDLGKYDLVIGFNIIKFDSKVLSGLCDFDFLSLPTLDILLKVHETLGYRLSLDHLVHNFL